MERLIVTFLSFQATQRNPRVLQQAVGQQQACIWEYGCQARQKLCTLKPQT